MIQASSPGNLRDTSEQVVLQWRSHPHQRSEAQQDVGAAGAVAPGAGVGIQYPARIGIALLKKKLEK